MITHSNIDVARLLLNNSFTLRHEPRLKKISIQYALISDLLGLNAFIYYNSEFTLVL